MFLMMCFLMLGEMKPQPIALQIHSKTVSTISGKTLDEQSWIYLRGANRIEKRALKGNGVMIWSRNALGEITMATRAAGWLIEYNPGDLKALEVERSWDELSQPLPGADLLHKLKKMPELTVDGQKVIPYEGVIGEARYRIHWSETLAAPVLWEREAAGRKNLIRIAETLPADQIKPFDTKTLRRMDYADVGDNEWLHGLLHNHSGGHNH